MRRPGLLAAAFLAAALALAPGLAMARAGDGLSLGSRGTRSFSLPPGTSTSPFGAAPLERSLTPPPAPNYGNPGYGNPGFGQGYGRRSPFMTGLMGGFLGAGLGGLLFGRGLFYGIGGFGSIFGLLIQLALIFWLVRWVFRRFFAGPVPIGPSLFARSGMQPGAMPRGVPLSAAPRPPVQIGPADYQAFEMLLKGVQQAWSNHDINTLRAVATPEMVSYFAEQLGEQASRGVHNFVTDVRLEQGDLAEAWAEDGREYATVAMRFSMVDVTRDQAGRVVDGSLVEHITATEVWTFLRVPGGRWILSAIQQAR